MATNRGKAFESRFKEDWYKSYPNSFLFRIPDQMNGYLTTSQNPCDFIGFTNKTLFLLECKSHRDNTFNWSNLRQYDKLKAKVGIPGVRAGVILWMIDHDTVIYLPISSVTKMMEDGKKSFNIKMLEENIYKIIVIPSVKKRVFMESDYSVLATLKDGD